MSATYTSIAGGNWAKNYSYFIPKRHSFLLGLMKTVAEMFDPNGRASPFLIQIIADMGNNPSRGQVMRGINIIEKLGLWTVSNRGGGRKRPLTITANRWMEPFDPPPPPPSKDALRESVSRARKSAPRESVSSKTDSSGTKTDSSRSPTHTGQTRKVHSPTVSDAAAEAAPSHVPAEAGPAEQRELVIKRKLPAQIATDDWNKEARRSRLVVASKPPYSLLNGKNGLLNHSAIRQDRTKWQEYFRYLAQDDRFGGRDWPANLEQACRRQHIDRWADKTAKRADFSNYTCEPEPIEPSWTMPPTADDFIERWVREHRVT
jgi:hypothetical protein